MDPPERDQDIFSMLLGSKYSSRPNSARFYIRKQVEAAVDNPFHSSPIRVITECTFYDPVDKTIDRSAA
jgi:hypothetical protein